ncbi:MAG TPA: flagellar protein FlgN [Steroidobacteraceae bacterium]|nr:flagellar protein FlgN [Steroidobacteraceae bacterium]
MAQAVRDVASHIGRILGEERVLLGELGRLLEEERQVLKEAAPEAIERVGATRQRCVEALSRLDAERSDACKLLSYGTGRTGFEKLLDALGPAAGLRERWHANLELARHCRELNDRNGALVSAKLNFVQKQLSVLRGTAPPPVYGRTLQRASALGSRDLGRA